MKNYTFKSLAIVVIAGLTLVGCNGLGKMAKNADTVSYNVDPSPLIVRGDSVELNVTGQYPEKYFSKKATLEVVPVLIYADGEQAYEAAYYQGVDAAGNYKVIAYDAPTSFSYNDKIAFAPGMETSDVVLRAVGSQGSKTKEFEAYPLAVGVRTTPYLMQNDDKVILAKDNFVRITNHEQYAVIHYLINSSVVRPAQLKDADMKEMSAFIKAAAANDRIELTSAVLDAYASPDGELTLNENLANDRAKSGGKVVASELKKNKITTPANFLQEVGKGEDWTGFKEKMEASDIKDKDLIIRILQMYSDPAKREQEIKNLAATYKVVAEKILPELRRTQIHLNYKKIGYSDEEITALSKSNPDTLNVEEILYAATLTNSLDEKLRIYMIAERNFPNDYRGANNVGYVLMMMGKPAEAKGQFEKALSVKSNPISSNNLGAVVRQEGNRKEAMELFKKAASAGPEVNYNMGLVDIQNGNYTSAITNFGSDKTFNVALAKVLNGDNEGALSTLNASPEKDTAMGYYLAAIIGARMGDGTAVKTNLDKAVELDPDLAVKAATDLEFINFWANL
jgi:tetratricopeptide (TPR) repeat protein